MEFELDLEALEKLPVAEYGPVDRCIDVTCIPPRTCVITHTY